MPAHIEWLDPKYKVGILRCGESLFNYGDPYEFVFVVCSLGNSAHLIAGIGKINQKMRNEILIQLTSNGIESITWDRIRKDGSTHRVGPIKLYKRRNLYADDSHRE